MRNIRFSREEDWDAISRVSRDSGYVDYINAIGQSFLEDGRVMVFEDPEIHGILKVEFLSDSSAWLSAIRVDPDQRRKNIGESLTQASLVYAQSQGIKKARMLIHDDNEASIRLAKKAGFAERERFLYLDGSIDLSPGVETTVTTSHLLNIGWKFIDPATSKRIDGRFVDLGKSKVFVHENGFGISTEPLEIDEPPKLTEGGITSVPFSLAHFFPERKPVEDFEYAIVFEKNL